MTKKSAFLLLAFSIIALPLTACSTSKTKKTLGMGRQSPDEFAVIQRAPLALPPSYTMNAPQPGALRPQETSTTDQARALVTGSSSAKTVGMSGSEAALLQQAGGAGANPDIRTILNQEYGVVSEDGEPVRTIDKLNPFKDTSSETGKLLDPTEEADALREKGVNAPKPVTPEPETKK